MPTSDSIVQGTWRKAKRGKWCCDCRGRIEVDGYFLEVDRYRWICPRCARKEAAR